MRVLPEIQVNRPAQFGGTAVCKKEKDPEWANWPHRESTHNFYRKPKGMPVGIILHVLFLQGVIYDQHCNANRSA